MIKSLFYFILAIFFAANLSAQNVNIPDATFKSALLKYTKINTNNDNEIQVSEAIAYSDSIDVSGKFIQNLTGIEAFVNIKKLNCDFNQLTTIDISKNTALTYLNCDFNQLTTINLSKNTALTYLDCYYNQLTSIDVSKNTALTYLDCYYNQLTTIDISKNTALTYLDCYHNHLTTINLSKNTALTYLNCDENQLTTIDVSKNTALILLSCYKNQLTTIDVSKNTALTTLDCSFNPIMAIDISQNIALIDLHCNANQLSTLDVSKNILLINMFCDSNQLKSLNLKNGANYKLKLFNAKGNLLLKCIQVDDPTKIGVDWEKDATATYSANCSVATEDVAVVQNLILYPNPAINTLQLRWEGNEVSVHLDLLNSVGTIVKSQNIDNQGSINIEGLPRGLYFSRLSNANHKTQTVKVVVE